jgi:hypothetical protein
MGPYANRRLNRVSPKPMSIVLALLLTAGFCGCSSISYHKGYEGPFKPVPEVAVLICTATAFAWTVDGRDALGKTIELTPGKHTLCAKFAISHGSRYTYSKNCVDVAHEFQAGHVYELSAVVYTHRESWFPVLRDITAELQYAERQDLLKNTITVLEKNRGVPVHAPWIPKKVKPEKLPGHGEKVTTETYVDRHGRTVTLAYEFYRDKPFVLAKGGDGNDYHIEISHADGKLVKVFGKKVILGSFIKGKNAIFQPVDSDLAYEYESECDAKDCTKALWAIYREVEPDQYQRIRNTHIVFFDDQVYSFLLNEDQVDGLPESAVQAAVLLNNADPTLIYNALAKTGAANPASLLAQTYETVAKLSAEALIRAADSVKGLTPGTPPHNQATAIAAAAGSFSKQSQAILARLNTSLPILPASASIRFFESPQQLLPLDQRRYGNRFARSNTRCIAWELNTQLQPPGRRMEYVVAALWKDAAGRTVCCQAITAYVEPHWNQFWNAYLLGWPKPGNWAPGNYFVDLIIGGSKIAAGQFHITVD